MPVLTALRRLQSKILANEEKTVSIYPRKTVVFCKNEMTLCLEENLGSILP